MREWNARYCAVGICWVLVWIGVPIPLAWQVLWQNGQVVIQAERVWTSIGLLYGQPLQLMESYGITAAAGTRLALQLLLAKGFMFGPFQSRIAPVRYFLSLPPLIKIG